MPEEASPHLPIEKWPETCHICSNIIWRPSLLHDLMWRVTHDPVPRPTCWIAPSWSWAATDSAVKFVGPRSGGRKFSSVTWHPTILEVSCNPKGSDPTGQVVSGFLRAKGPLVPAYISRAALFGRQYYLHRFHPSDDRYSERFPGLRGGLFLDHPLEDRVEKFTAAPPFAIYCLAMVTFFTEYGWEEGFMEKYMEGWIGRELELVKNIDPQSRRAPLVSKLFSKEATKDTVIKIE